MKYFTDLLDHANAFIIPHKEVTTLGNTGNGLALEKPIPTSWNLLA